MQVGANAVVVMLQGVLLRMLSRRGTGQVYLRRVAGTFRLQRQSQATAKKFGLKVDRLGRVLGGDARYRRYIRSTRNLYGTGLVRSSAPGQPPAPQTGRLRLSWQSGQAATSGRERTAGYTLRIGSRVRYAPYLEYGTGRMLPRPYVTPSIEEARPKAARVFGVAFRAAAAQFLSGGRP
jgi:hypothetical protein